jgi:hypothetical protein
MPKTSKVTLVENCKCPRCQNLFPRAVTLLTMSEASQLGPHACLLITCGGCGATVPANLGELVEQSEHV